MGRYPASDLPAVLKAYGVTLANYDQPEKIHDVVLFQMWFSIFAWAVLAGVVAALMRRLWLKPLAFGLVLFYSLTPEISLWDSLILSESVSFSLFALLVAAWMAWMTGLMGRAQFSGVKLGLATLLTGLYIFARESNQYFVLFGAVAFLGAAYLGRAYPVKRRHAWVYFGVFVVWVLLKSLSFGAGDIWQIHLADLLAHRILPNPQALDYFAAAGLPVDDRLLAVQGMPGHEYQAYLLENPEMAAVRAWINEAGVSTYLKYLLSHPWETLQAPLAHAASLLSPDNMDYHYPRFGVPTLPPWLVALTARLYPRWPLALWGMGALALGGWAVSLPLADGARRLAGYRRVFAQFISVDVHCLAWQSH